MRTTLIIPSELMAEALFITGFQSKTDVVIQCLKEYIRAFKRQKLKESLDKFSFELNLDQSRRRPRKSRKT